MKHKLTAITAVVLCSLTLAVLVGGIQPLNRLNIFVPISDIEQAKVQQVGDNQAVINVGEFPQGGSPGEPMLPYRQVCVLVPPDADLGTASAGLASENWEELPGSYEIAAVKPAATWDGEKFIISWGNKDESYIINGRDSSIYGNDAYFPSRPVEVVSVSKFRQWKLVELRVWLALYNPVQKKVRTLKAAQPVLSVQKLPAGQAVGLDSAVLPAIPNTEKFEPQLRSRIANPQDIETFYGQQAVPAAQSGDPAPSLVPADYVIITTSTIVATSTKLASFVTAKQTAGYTVKTVTEGATEGDYTYITGTTCDQRADNIRIWLVNHYIGDGIEYVLLIGDPHPTTFSATTSIPMKMCWPRSGAPSDEKAPTDMYFAELSGNWDLDSDTKYGEFSDDYAAGGADKNCELKVGRIPFYNNYTDLDAILQKSINYGAPVGSTSWRSKVLIPAAVSNFGPQDETGNGVANSPFLTASDRTFGADWGEDIKSLASSVSFSPYTLYERTGVYAGGSAYPLTSCDAPLNNANFIAEWQNIYGFVTWWAHGSQTDAQRFCWTSDATFVNIMGNQTPHYEANWYTLVSNADCASLDDTKPSFVVQISCNNGYPENVNNLGYRLLKQGAIGTISGTRLTWYLVGSWTTSAGATYSDNASYGYHIFDEMAASAETIGTALVNCRSNFGTAWTTYGSSWANMVGLNLYGDPSLSLGLTTSSYKWEQLPDETVYGIDIRCDTADGMQRTLADDFLCTTTGPITDVTIWGSWLSDIKGQIQKIHLSIHSDDPVGPGGSDPDNTYSMPDTLLWQQDFTSADFIEMLYKYDEPEWFWDPTVGTPPPTSLEHYGIWQYDISIDSNQFIQQGDPCNTIIYWLDVWVDLVPDQNSPAFGWKTSPDHWKDDAVFLDTTGTWQELLYPPPHGYAPDSIDLSFRIITAEEEEPSDIKWIQEPDLTPTGIDIRVDRSDGIARIMADDFNCTTTGLITDAHIWGSWKYDDKGEIVKIHLSIHSDDPVGPGGSDPDNDYSKPDTLLWEKDFGPADFNESLYYTLPAPDYEWWWDIVNGDLLPDGDTQVWKYDIYIDPCDAFRQEGDPCQPIVYWLDVYVEIDDINYPGSEFGWKTSLEHWNDDAVYADVPAAPFNWQELRYPLGHEYEGDSIDMAFAITTEANEPVYDKPLEPHTKWSQPPIEIDPTSAVPTYCGWDEESHNMVEPETPLMKIVADDYHCIGSMPVTSIHWWGSFLDWEWSWAQGTLPPVLPEKWWIGFWSNVPANAPPYYMTYSYPDTLLHSITIDANRVAFEEVGSDEYYGYYPYDICYQYNVDLEPEEVFWQDDFNGVTQNDIYWISIVAEYNDVAEPPYYKWGWKTRAWHWMDDAVKFTLNFEPAAGFVIDPLIVTPIVEPMWGDSFDMAFELNTDPNYIKWEQLYTGIRNWPHYEDEESMFDMLNPEEERLVADDWRCLRRTPVTAIVWWGSYIGYGSEACGYPPFMSLPVPPDRFRLTMWTDVPADDPCNTYDYSHPGEVIWQYDVAEYDEVLVGYDKHPHGAPNEPVFRYSVRLPEDEWFRQPDYNEVFWLGVQAVYEVNMPNYDWGWTNHKHVFNDDAVQGYWDLDEWKWDELYDQTEASADMSFMLFTDPDICSTCANYNCDARVNFLDYADFADDWRWVGPAGGYNNSDLDCNGVVNFKDLGIFCMQWLNSSCP